MASRDVESSVLDWTDQDLFSLPIGLRDLTFTVTGFFTTII